MASKVISMSEDKGTESMTCDCGGKLTYQSEWDRLFDFYDKSVPAFDLIYNRIYKDDREPKYICNKCSLQVFVVPDYAVKK